MCPVNPNKCLRTKWSLRASQTWEINKILSRSRAVLPVRLSAWPDWYNKHKKSIRVEFRSKCRRKPVVKHDATAGGLGGGGEGVVSCCFLIAQRGLLPVPKGYFTDVFRCWTKLQAWPAKLCPERFSPSFCFLLSSSTVFLCLEPITVRRLPITIRPVYNSVDSKCFSYTSSKHKLL